MIKNLFKRQETIKGAALILAVFTILAQLLSIVKNKLLAIHFGASIDLDIFYTAFKIPDIIYLIIGGFAVSSILIPIFTSKENISLKEKEEYMARFFNSFSILLFIISLLIFIFMPLLLKVIFPVYKGEEMELLLWLSRLFILSPILLSLSNFFISINQRNKIFLPMALTGLLYNISIVLGIVFLVPVYGIRGVAYSVIFGASLHLLIQLPSIFKHKLFKYKFLCLSRKEKKDISKTVFPRSIALSIISFVIIYMYSVISNLETEGLVTIFSFAYSIFWLPIALVNSAYSQAMLPTISKFFSQGKLKEFNLVIKNVISKTLFTTFPIVFFMIGFSDLIIQTLFGSEKFYFEEIKATSIILSLFAILIPFHTILIMFSKIFYSMGRTKDVMWTNIIASIMIVILTKIKLDLFNFNEIISIDKFNDLFNLVFIFISSYITATFFMVWKMKRVVKINIFNFKTIFQEILISLIAIIILRPIYVYFVKNIELNFIKNILTLSLFGILFLIIIWILLKLVNNKNYKSFKIKMLKEK